MFLSYDLNGTGTSPAVIEQLNIDRVLTVRQLLVTIDRIRSVFRSERPWVWRWSQLSQPRPCSLMWVC